MTRNPQQTKAFLTLFRIQRFDKAEEKPLKTRIVHSGIAWFLNEFEALAFQHVAISIFYCVALETENSVRRFVAQSSRHKTLKILGQDWYTGLKLKPRVNGTQSIGITVERLLFSLTTVRVAQPLRG